MNNCCNRRCRPFVNFKTDETVDIICMTCPHNQSLSGADAGYHYRFCKCVFDNRYEQGVRADMVKDGIEMARWDRGQQSQSPRRSSSMRSGSP
jgi:hypothetical protein